MANGPFANFHASIEPHPINGQPSTVTLVEGAGSKTQTYIGDLNPQNGQITGMEDPHNLVHDNPGQPNSNGQTPRDTALQPIVDQCIVDNTGKPFPQNRSCDLPKALGSAQQRIKARGPQP